MANVFKEAKKYTRAHPRTSFQDAIKIVSKKMRGVKRKSVGKKSSHSHKRYTKRRVASVSKNADKTDNKKVDISIGNISPAQAVSLAKNTLKEQQAFMYVAKSSAKTKTAKRKIQKKINEVGAKIRALEK